MGGEAAAGLPGGILPGGPPEVRKDERQGADPRTGGIGGPEGDNRPEDLQSFTKVSGFTTIQVGNGNAPAGKGGTDVEVMDFPLFSRAKISIYFYLIC